MFLEEVLMSKKIIIIHGVSFIIFLIIVPSLYLFFQYYIRTDRKISRVRVRFLVYSGRKNPYFIIRNEGLIVKIEQMIAYCMNKPGEKRKNLTPPSKFVYGGILLEFYNINKKLLKAYKVYGNEVMKIKVKRKEGKKIIEGKEFYL